MYGMKEFPEEPEFLWSFLDQKLENTVLLLLLKLSHKSFDFYNMKFLF